MTTPAPEPTQRPATPARGFRGVWPGLGLVLMLGAIAYLAVPSFRDQVAVSLTRRDAPFVELYAVMVDDKSHAGTTCAPQDGPGTTRVIFAMRSHLSERDTLHYQVAVTLQPASDQVTAAPVQLYRQRVFDRVNIDPGATRSVQLDLPVPPDQPFDVTITLPASDQSLLLHCAAQVAG